jgi:tetratricopeptide (TPR) repeat protein
MHNLKRHLLLLTLVFAVYWHAAAQSLPDSVIHQYESAKTDKEKLSRLYDYLHKPGSDTSFYSKATILIGFLRSVNDTRSQDIVQLDINDYLLRKGEYASALASTMEITDRFEQRKDKADILYVYRILSPIYFYAGERENSIIYGKKALLIAKEFNNAFALAEITNGISTSYSQNNMPDSALLYARQSLIYTRKPVMLIQ